MNKIKTQKQLNQTQTHNKSKDKKKRKIKRKKKKTVSQLFRITSKIADLLSSLKIEKIKQK